MSFHMILHHFPYIWSKYEKYSDSSEKRSMFIREPLLILNFSMYKCYSFWHKSPLSTRKKMKSSKILTLLQTVIRIQINSAFMFYCSISRVLSNKKGFSFLGFTVIEIWPKIGIKWKITLLMIVNWKGVLFLLLPTTTILHSSM
jgi:hypothetical protein